MGRSVMVPSNAEVTFYFTHSEYEELEEIGYDYLVEDLQGTMTALDQSFRDSKGWMGNEERVVSENHLCSVVLCEYCGLYSLSFVPKEDVDVWEPIQDNEEAVRALVAGWIDTFTDKVAEELPNIGCELYQRSGTFSNGVGVFRKVEWKYVG